MWGRVRGHRVPRRRSFARPSRTTERYPVHFSIDHDALSCRRTTNTTSAESAKRERSTLSSPGGDCQRTSSSIEQAMLKTVDSRIGSRRSCSQRAHGKAVACPVPGMPILPRYRPKDALAAPMLQPPTRSGDWHARLISPCFSAVSRGAPDRPSIRVRSCVARVPNRTARCPYLGPARRRYGISRRAGRQKSRIEKNSSHSPRNSSCVVKRRASAMPHRTRNAFPPRRATSVRGRRASCWRSATRGSVRHLHRPAQDPGKSMSDDSAHGACEPCRNADSHDDRHDALWTDDQRAQHDRR